MTTAFIIAGFDLQNTAASDKYVILEKGLESRGYKVAASNISWQRKTPSQYAAEFVKFYIQHKSDKNIVIGNSFGAVVAFITAAEIKPEALYLCSLSAFFKEDRGKLPDSYGVDIFGKRRMEDLWSISAVDLADRINIADVKTIVTFGEKEHQTSPTLVARCTDTAKHIKHSQLVEISNAPHSMADKIYSDALVRLVSL
jgi:pimeloyl-ACP methyl ester carboxylesterase